MLRRLLTTSVAASLMFLVMAPLPAQSERPSTEDEAASEEVIPQKIDLEQEQTHEALGLSFKSPEGFSPVQALNRKTTGIVYPNSRKVAPRMIVRLAELESNADNWVKFSPQEQMIYAKYLFLGSNSPTHEQKEREFFGVPVRGEVQTIRTRDGYRYLEIYILTLEKTPRQIAIAFESDTRLPLVEVETTMEQVAQSLEELDPKAKKKKKKKKQATEQISQLD